MNHEEAIKVIGTTGIGNDSYVFKYQGQYITIAKHDSDFFESLRRLPAELRCRMMDLTISDLQNEIDRQANTLRESLKKYLSQKWQWRETGDPYNFEDAEMNQIMFKQEMKRGQIMRKLKARKFTVHDMLTMVNTFEKENREIMEVEE